MLPTRIPIACTSLAPVLLFPPAPSGPSGEPIADSFGVLAGTNCACLAIADGVNWGQKARLASRCAIHAVMTYVHKRIFSRSSKSGEKAVRNTRVSSVASRLLAVAEVPGCLWASHDAWLPSVSFTVKTSTCSSVVCKSVPKPQHSSEVRAELVLCHDIIFTLIAVVLKVTQIASLFAQLNCMHNV